MGFAFDRERYRDRIEASERRLRAARSFREPDQVPVSISVGGSFFCGLAGRDIAEYYRSRELSLEVQLRGLEWVWEELRDDRTGAGLHLDIGPLQEALVFGAEIVRPEGTSPWGRHCLTDLADIDGLEVPDPATNAGVQWVYEEMEKLRELARRRNVPLPVSGGLTIHPPLSAACALAGPERIYAWMYEAPEMVKRLFDKLFLTFCLLIDHRDDREGSRRRSIGLADDNSAFVSEQMYREFVMPHNRAIYERYGKEGRQLHADGPNDHLFRLYADEMRLTEMDIGGFSDIAAAKPAMAGKTVIFGGINCTDLYGSFEVARPSVARAVGIGAPGGGYIFGVGGETYAGVNADTLVQVVEHARRISRSCSMTHLGGP